MKRRLFQTGLILVLLFSFTAFAGAQSEMPVKFNVKQGEGDFVGGRLVALVRQRIEKSDKLKIAGEDEYMLIVDMITMKIKGRPSSAYSYVVTFNAYGKQTPVLMHRLGITGNTRVYNAADSIVADFESLAAEARGRLKKSGE